MTSVILTSIAPRDLETQLAAIRTWSVLDLPIVSLNQPAEIETISAGGLSWPANLRFVAPERVGTGVYGRPLVYLDSIVAEADRMGCDSFVLINADNAIQDPESAQVALDATDCAVIMSNRVDVDADGGDPDIYLYGFDFFLVRRAAFDAVRPSGLCLGVPFIDYVAPAGAYLAGLDVGILRHPAVSHIRHDTRWSFDCYCTGDYFFHLFLDQKLATGAPDRVATFSTAFTRASMATRQHYLRTLSVAMQRLEAAKDQFRQSWQNTYDLTTAYGSTTVQAIHDVVRRI